MDGAVAMVGSSCAKRFPRARASDLIRSTKRDRAQPLPTSGYKIRISRDLKGLGLNKFRALVFIVNTQTKDLIIGRMGHIDLLHEERMRTGRSPILGPEGIIPQPERSLDDFRGGRVFPLEGKVSFTSGTIRVVADADRSEVLAALESAIGTKLSIVEPHFASDRAVLAYGYTPPPKQIPEAEFFKLFPVAPHHKSVPYYTKWKGYGVAWSGGSKDRKWGKLSGPLVSFYDPYQKRWLETIFIDPDTNRPLPVDRFTDPISYKLAEEWLDTFRTWQPPPDEARAGGGHTYSKGRR
jgi:hypothetical protein